MTPVDYTRAMIWTAFRAASVTRAMAMASWYAAKGERQ